MSTSATVKDEWSNFSAGVLPGVDHLHARFVRHTYTRHSHDQAYVFGFIVDGAQTSSYGTASFVAEPGSVVVINPGESHDGRAYTSKGYVYHSLHVNTALLDSLFEESKEDLAPGARRIAAPEALFPAPVFRDRTISAAFGRLFKVLVDPGAQEIEREAYFINAVTQIFECGRLFPGRPAARNERAPRLAEKVRALLHAHMSENTVSVDGLARACGVTRSHFTRAFAAEFGLPPHAYLTKIRVGEARKRILDGEAPIAVAAAVGFVDQSHLIRRFKSIYGVTPGQLRSASMVSGN